MSRIRENVGVDGRTLLADRQFPWQDGNPYDILNEQLKAANKPVLGPMSSAADVNKASFALQAAGRKIWEQLRPHWDRLRIPRTRLGIDFFHYPLSDLPIEDLGPSSWEQPMPMAEPDLMSIADCRIELANPPQAEAQTAALADLLPEPLFAEPPSLFELIEVDDDQQ